MTTQITKCKSGSTNVGYKTDILSTDLFGSITVPLSASLTLPEGPGTREGLDRTFLGSYARITFGEDKCAFLSAVAMALFELTGRSAFMLTW